MKLLITGGCGFIGSHYVRLVSKRHPEDVMVNVDMLTYAGKKENLKDFKSDRYDLVKGNICDRELISELFNKYDFDAVINFAAESHVDRSILGPRVFVESNVTGVLNLLECAYRHWKNASNWKEKKRFLQISTDEVYGSLSHEDKSAKFSENTPLNPSSPYSASKASADLLVHAYFHTFGMPTLITRSSNNYGPNQDEEKFIPLMTSKAILNEKVPVYGDGKNIRDWLHVDDNCSAINHVLRRAKPGSVYNIGGGNEWQNIEVVRMILGELKKPEDLIQFVADRLGHDRRYAVNDELIRNELSWKPKVSFKKGLADTVDWYVQKSRT